MFLLVPWNGDSLREIVFPRDKRNGHQICIEDTFSLGPLPSDLLGRLHVLGFCWKLAHALFKEFMDLLINLFSFPQISFGETGGHVLWNLPGFKSQLYPTPSVGPSDPHFPHL